MDHQIQASGWKAVIASHGVELQILPGQDPWSNFESSVVESREHMRMSGVPQASPQVRNDDSNLRNVVAEQISSVIKILSKTLRSQIAMNYITGAGRDLGYRG